MKQYKKQTFNHYDNKCVLTGSTKNLSIHHIKPKRDGGSNKVTNCVPITQKMHNMFNLIEVYDSILSMEVNHLFERMFAASIEERKELSNNIRPKINNEYKKIKRLRKDNPIIMKHWDYRDLKDEFYS